MFYRNGERQNFWSKLGPSSVHCIQIHYNSMSAKMCVCAGCHIWRRYNRQPWSSLISLMGQLKGPPEMGIFAEKSEFSITNNLLLCYEAILNFCLLVELNEDAFKHCLSNYNVPQSLTEPTILAWPCLILLYDTYISPHIGWHVNN